MSNVDDFEDDEDFGEDEGEDDADDLHFCVECMEPFRYDDCGGYNPPCECGLHCLSCHEAAEHREHDDDDDDEPDEEAERATERFWDGRVGHSSTAADDNEPPF